MCFVTATQNSAMLISACCDSMCAFVALIQRLHFNYLFDFRQSSVYPNACLSPLRSLSPSIVWWHSTHLSLNCAINPFIKSFVPHCRCPPSPLTHTLIFNARAVVSIAGTVPTLPLTHYYLQRTCCRFDCRYRADLGAMVITGLGGGNPLSVLCRQISMDV